jgi:uridine phosphorylase
MIAASELLLNPDDSVYHLNLKPEDLANNIIFVGDVERLTLVSQYLGDVKVVVGKKGFETHTGMYGGKPISVIAVGMGTDNIDIVMNELDALVNIDLDTKLLKPTLTSLHIIRIGTSGSIQGNIAMGTMLVSEYAIGLDALMQYYIKPYTDAERRVEEAVVRTFPELTLRPYASAASTELMDRVGRDLPKGITMTVPGFYGPQGRNVRLHNVYPDIIQRANTFRAEGRVITHLEMETAGIYALANMLGHHALSINVILASRVNDDYSTDPKLMITDMISYVLERL